jgi:choline dehydrogenase-like flavoprotein
MSGSDPFAPEAPEVITEPGRRLDCDVAIIGAGVGGGTMAWALRDSGARVLILEHGDFLPREWQNWSARAVHHDGRYRNSAAWVGPDGVAAVPGNYHYVGGSSKLYGATLPRLRPPDFGEVHTRDGVSPAWPVTYRQMEPFYERAEELFWVHGDDSDADGAPRAHPFPFPALAHEPPIARLARRLQRQGLHPIHLPQAVDWRPGGKCVLCRTCDSYSCLVDAKGDADVCAIRPALQSPTVRLVTNAEVRRIVTGDDGSSVTRLEVGHASGPLTVTAARYVLAAGAVNSAALLLRSRGPASPDGVANRSGMVGRNYMAHPSTFVVGVLPARENHITYEKTLAFNDWYFAGPTTEFPLGHVQNVGKLQGWTIKSHRRWVPRSILEWMTERSVDFIAMTEDLPHPDSRVTVDDAGQIHLNWFATNVESHAELVRRTVRALRRCGYPFVFTQRLPWSATSHQCGTAAMGADPATSVVDPDCRSHDVDNLWIVDTSVFPSSAAVNPALTVAANVMRVAAQGTLTS